MLFRSQRPSCSRALRARSLSHNQAARTPCGRARSPTAKLLARPAGVLALQRPSCLHAQRARSLPHGQAARAPFGRALSPPSCSHALRARSLPHHQAARTPCGRARSPTAKLLARPAGVLAPPPPIALRARLRKANVKYHEKQNRNDLYLLTVVICKNNRRFSLSPSVNISSLLFRVCVCPHGLVFVFFSLPVCPFLCPNSCFFCRACVHVLLLCCIL